ncbi:hypothetical protein GmHk_08G023434 [Glycine max]|nr:hypothetical protein GmHk_08G023434 [Glycine max]KAH1238845.1 hypothetical protein GmHk_08G023434 [Glycine max]KAH1238848.1 hypothetical protein GmHk_08G023434 [Glycine max]
MSEAVKEIAEKIVSHFQLRIVIIFVYSVNALDKYMCYASQGSFVPHGRQDVLTTAIGRPEHPSRVHAARAKFEQLTQQIRDQLEESITEKVTRQLMTSFSQMQSQLQSQMQLQGLALPPEPKVGPSATRVSTKWSYVDPSPTDPETGDLDKCGLYIEENPSHLVSLGRVYEGSTAVHNIPFLHRQVRVSVEEVKDAKAPVPVPTDKAVVSPAKPPDRAHPEVDDPLYLMTLTIPHLFLRPLQVMWDATVFGVFNQDFPLYIKHADLSEITHDGQCLSISILQLWIMHLTETSMRAGNFDVYGFLKPQSTQRSGQSQFESESHIKSWMQSSKCDVYLGSYL